MKFDFKGYSTEQILDMLTEVGQELFLKYPCDTEYNKQKKRFYGFICQILRKELDKRLETDY